MSFKEQAIGDISTFLNVEEFGDTIEIDGAPMACVLVADETTNSADGVSALESTLYVRASNFATAPVVRQRLKIGDQTGTITRVDEEQGILLIRLQWFAS